jgi:Na+-transporting methylmalonyl-CoA/oxaloacetate decarboxylase gamma subunit
MCNQQKIIVKMGFGFVVLLIALVIIIWGFTALHKPYSVWAESKNGEAELAKAKYSRKIAVVEAEAKSAAATELAKAEIIRARGVAEANKIIGDSLKNNADYLKYLWVNNLGSEHNKIIYVPTEANLPILEANRDRA